MTRGLVVITGTTHGIGRVTARELARAGWSLVMLCRDVALAAAVRADIRQRAAPQARIDIVPCDLASLASVRAAAASVRREHGGISRLIHNAGIVSTQPRLSADGFELVFAVNHLGPFLLTQLLLDRLQPGGRVIHVASCAHEGATLDLGRVLPPLTGYRARAAYAQSKLANILHSQALARRLQGSGVGAFSLHPGVVATNLLPRWLRLLKPLVRRTISAEAGARCTLHVAQDEAVGLLSGAYFDEHGQVLAPSALALDVGLQETLWAASERWVGARALAVR